MVTTLRPMLARGLLFGRPTVCRSAHVWQAKGLPQPRRHGFTAGARTPGGPCALDRDAYNRAIILTNRLQFEKFGGEPAMSTVAKSKKPAGKIKLQPLG